MSMMSGQGGNTVDFEALLTRNYKPARVTHLIPREKSTVPSRRHRNNNADDGSIIPITKKETTAIVDRKKSNNEILEDKILKLTMELVSKTPAYERHVKTEDDDHDEQKEKQHDSEKHKHKQINNHPYPKQPAIIKNEWQTLPKSLHPIELSNWEKSIQWEGATSNNKNTVSDDSSSDDNNNMLSIVKRKTATNGNNNNTKHKTNTAQELLQHCRNPYLEALQFNSFNICWEGLDNPQKIKEKARNVPLILDKGVAGQSVALSLVPSKRPEPFGQSIAYQNRLDRDEWAHGSASGITSTANVSGDKGGSAASLHADRDQMEAFIKERQKKRAAMAQEKTSRVLEAMGTLAGHLGSAGKGRTITSSLMGPGGTERTGRPSRNIADSSLTHEVEYIEHLPLVENHTLVKPDLRRVELRQYHRPKLPRNVVRIDLPWQFQVRVDLSKMKGKNSGRNRRNSTSSINADGSVTTSYHSSAAAGGGAGGAMHAGALSQESIKTEADLSPAEGELVLFEYCEERPPIQLTKGMSCKIVNYYRGDKTRCPVSRGGGDRPAKRKQHGSAENAEDKNNTNKNNSNNKVERPPKLIGPNDEKSSSIIDWIGKPPKRAIASGSGVGGGDGEGGEGGGKSKSSINILPEGVTEILPPKIHGPFIGSVEEGQTQTGLICNLFAAPMFRHEAETSDFLMILGRKPGGFVRPGVPPEPLGVTLRCMPSSVFTVGQTEPRRKVFAPNTTGERNFSGPFICYQIAKALTRTQEKEKRGLRFDEINDRLFANTTILPNALRQRIKQVAIYDKNTQIWTTKSIGYEDYPGYEALGRKFSPEGVAAYETQYAAARRLCDLGMHDLVSGTGTVSNVALAMIYLTGQMNAARERKSKMLKMLEFAKNAKNTTSTQIALYEKAASLLEANWKKMRRRHEVARFIYEELQLAPWHLTSEFIDVHKHAQGSGMMKLTGLADPSGLGEGYNFLRESDTKPNKTSGNSDGALSAQIKKITGTENDLRKLTMKQMASLLRSYGMNQKDIDTLKRWDRVHVIRDLSTKAASDGMGDGLERFARGEKMKLSEQKEMYQQRIQEIWRRQRAALSTDAGVLSGQASSANGGGGAASVPGGGEAGGLSAMTTNESGKEAKKDNDESDSDSDDEDDLEGMLIDEMMDVRQTNELVNQHLRNNDDNADLASAVSQQRREGVTEDLSKDARELAALKKQREEERAAQEGLFGAPPTAPTAEKKLPALGRKVIRKRVTKTHPDGRQTVSFKFIVVTTEVDKIIARKKKEKEASAEKEEKTSKKKGSKHKHHHDDKRVVGHAVFEEEDEYDHARGRMHLKLQMKKTTRVIKTKGGKTVPHSMAKTTLGKVKRPKPHLGKLKQKVSQEKRLKKRKREAEEADLYVATAKRKGTSNRRERGAARDRMPHVILSDRLELVRNAAEKLPNSGPFHRPVNRRMLPRYYEVISNPIDLQTIRDKNQRYEYKTADTLLRDFDLMKSNAIKFNGLGSPLGNTATSIYDFVKEQIEQNRQEFTAMEVAVKDQLSGKKKANKAASKAKAPSKPTESKSGNSSTSNVVVDGVAVNLGDLGDLSKDLNMDGADSDSDGSFTGLIGGS